MLGHKDSSGIFHPHSSGSGIYSSQIIERNLSGVQPKPDKNQIHVSNFINKHKEKFKERKKIAEMKPDDSGSVERQIELEKSLNETRLNRLLNTSLTPEFMLSELQEFKKENNSMLNDATKKKLDSEIKKWDTFTKQSDAIHEEVKNQKKKSGIDVLFPSGSQNQEKFGIAEKKIFDERQKRDENVKNILDKQDKIVNDNERKLAEQLEQIRVKEEKLKDKEELIRSDPMLSVQQKQNALSKIKETKDDIEEHRRIALSKVNSQGEKQVLIGLGVLG